MLKIRIIVVGRTRAEFLRQGEEFYLERLRRYAGIEWVVARPAPIGKNRPELEVLAEEGRSIAGKLQPREYVIALDRSGKAYDSPGLSRRLDRWSQQGVPLAFLVGGHLGLSESNLRLAGEILSLSPLTFTHEMSRLIFLEQLYRAFTILNNEKYHK